ncbi:TPA: DUF4238 domain-containing protein, partial [Enterobacter chengduensis]|nr:DUF4238 domain-containing protein [Enterobacter chengduensis]
WYGSVVEPKIGDFLKQVEELNEIDSQNEGLAWLLSSLLLRNPQHREMIESPLIHAERVAKSMQEDYKEQGIDLDIEGISFSKNDIIGYEIQQTKALSKCLPLYNYCILKAPTGINVITSDAPMILANSLNKKIFGLASKGTMIIAPLNKSTYIVGSKEIKFPALRIGTIWEIANLNTMVMASANEKIYSNDDHIYILDDKDEVIKYPN